MATVIAARSEAEAFRHYAAPLQRVIAAFAENTFIQRARFDVRAGANSLQIAGRTAMLLHDAGRRPRVALAADLTYRVVQLEVVPARWTVRTVAYFFNLSEASDPGRPIASYHWHPYVLST